MTKDKRDLVIRISADTKDINNELKKIEKNTGKLGRDLERVTKKATIGFTVLVTSIGATFKAFANFEEKMLGVAKTADLTDDELKGLSKDIQNMSRQLPFATNELAAIAEAAGQMGIKGSENILKFTETIAKLSTATDLAGEEAARSMAVILNATGEPIKNVEKLASTIVALGNAFPAVESKIARTTTLLATSTTAINLNSRELAALASALAAVDVRAELAGSAIGRTFAKISKAIREGGESMRILERFTGLAGDALKEAFDERPLELLQRFTQGLSKLKGTGESAEEVLEKLGLAGDEIRRTLGPLINRAQKFEEAIAIMNKESVKATALNQEFNRLMTAQNTNLKLLFNTFKVFTQEIGVRFVPVVNKVVDGAKSLLDAFLGLDERTKDIIGKVVVFGTALVGIAAGLGAVALAVIKFGAAFKIAGVAVAAIFGSTGGLVVVGLAVATVALVKFIDKMGGLERVTLILKAGFTSFFNFFIRRWNDVTITLLEVINLFFKLNKAFTDLFPGDLFKEKSDQFKKLTEGIQKEIDATIAKNKELEKSFTDIFFDLRDKQQKKEEEEKEQKEEESFEKETAKKLRMAEEREARILAQEEEFRARRAEIDEEIKLVEEEIRLEEDEIEQELLRDKLEELQGIRDEFSTKEELARNKALERILAREGKFNDRRKTADEKLNDDRRKLMEENLDTVAKFGSLVFGESKKWAIAHFLLTKAFSLRESIIKLKGAIVSAFETGGPFPKNLIAAGLVAAKGATEIAAIRAQGLPAITGAQQGGLAGDTRGGPRGDRLPFLLEGGELITPRNNFDEVIEATARARGFVQQDVDTGGARDVNVMIDIADNAAQIITAQQFENATIGVDR